VKVLHAPIQIAGQLWEYADGLRKIGVESKALTFSQHPFGYRDDICLNLQSIKDEYYFVGKMIKNFVEVVGIFDVFHFHFGESLIAQNYDLLALKEMGKKMVMNFWGSDVRIKDLAKLKNPFYTDEMHLGNDEEKIRKLKLISQYIDVAVVADYELYEYVSPFFKRTEIVRQAVDLEELRAHYPNKKRPIIVHAPSRMDVKGTIYIEKAIKSLVPKYDFEYIRITGFNHDELIEKLRQADIVIDQMLIGSYGILAVESMALGKPVMSYIRDDLIDKYPENLPIIVANPDNIAEVLKTLLQDGNLRIELGHKSREYVEMYHDKIKIAKDLVRLYETL